jgi:hypothetical protein
LDYRTIKAEDVALQIITNNLIQKRTIKSQQRLSNAIDNNKKKLDEITNADEVLWNRQMQDDAAKTSNLLLIDKINFSIINLLF